MPDSTFTVQLAAYIRCRCGRLYDLSGLQVVEADAVLDVVHEFDGPCPGCAEPDGGGEGVAAE